MVSRSLVATFVVCWTAVAAGQIPVGDLQLLEGPWECRNASGIHGVFITATTLLTEKSGQQDITSQSLNIRVYERQAGQEHSGYFSPTVLNSRRLIMHFKDRTDIPPFDLDLSFDPDARRWTGFWSLCDKSQDVILDRPRPREGVALNPLVADWEGYTPPTASFRSSPGTLHVRQSYDGSLTAWLDRTLSAFDPRMQSTRIDQRNGEQLRVLSATQTGIVLANVNSLGASYQYEGTLSGDGKGIIGHWQAVGGFGGSLNAPTHYRLLGLVSK